MEPNILQLIGVIALTATAMGTDLSYRRIPNWLTVGGLIAGLVFHTATSGWQGLGFSLGGFAVGFGVLLVLWFIGGGGGGDVKLMGALGAWLGATSTIVVFLLSALMALACLMVLVVWNLVAPQTVPAGTAGPEGKKSVFKTTIPYAIPAGMASWIVLLAKMSVVQ